VLGVRDLLERVLCFLLTPADLGRCAAVNRAFRLATPIGLRAALARSFPAASALEKYGVKLLDPGMPGGLGLRIARALASPGPQEISAPPPGTYKIIAEVQSPRRGNVEVFKGEVCFTDADADLPLTVVTSLEPSSALLHSTLDFDGFHFPGDIIEDYEDEHLADADLAGSRYGCSSAGRLIINPSFYKRHVFNDSYLTVDITLVRLVDGAVCNFAQGARAFSPDPSSWHGRMGVGDLETIAHGPVISPWAPHRNLDTHEQIGMRLKFSVGETREELRLTQVEISPCVYAMHLVHREEPYDHPYCDLDAQGTACALHAADLPWVVSDSANHAERLRIARDSPPAAVTGDDAPAKVWPSRPPSSSLNGYYAMLRVRDHHFSEDQVCFSSCAVLTDDLAATENSRYDGRGQIFDNALVLPYAEQAAFWDSLDGGLDNVWNGHQWQARMELDIVLVRIGDGAVHNLAHRHRNDESGVFYPESDDVGGRAN
jgi:hypothetical protein